VTADPSEAGLPSGNATMAPTFHNTAKFARSLSQEGECAQIHQRFTSVLSLDGRKRHRLYPRLSGPLQLPESASSNRGRARENFSTAACAQYSQRKEAMKMGLLEVMLNGKLLVSEEIADSQKLGDIEERFIECAEVAEIDPDDYARQLIFQVDQDRRDHLTITDEQRDAALFLALNRDSEDAARSGKLKGYLGECNFRVDLRPQSAQGTVTARIFATPLE
jgi:hypothetical protein